MPLLRVRGRRGWGYRVVRDAGHSAATTDRPGLREALGAIAERRADGLAVAKLDRLARSVVDFANLMAWFHRGGATLVCLDLGVDTSTAAGRLVGNVFASVAEWEREAIAERTSATLSAKRARREPISRPAVADRPEIGERIAVLRAQGLTLRAIASVLNGEGVPTMRGAQRWSVSAVQSAVGYRRPASARRSGDLPQFVARPRGSKGKGLTRGRPKG